MGIALVIGIVVLLVLAATMIVASGRNRSATGALSRETRRRDASRGARLAAEADAQADAEAHADARAEAAAQAEADARTAAAAREAAAADAEATRAARARADEARRELGAGGAAPATVGARTPARREPVDEEQLGVTRRQFFNRGILATMAVALGAFGGAALAFIYSKSAGGFGGKVATGRTAASIKADLTSTKAPVYFPEARAYIQPYPEDDISKAKSVYEPQIVANMEELGLLALYQKCPHLGCKVPWCQTSQWFECPCHGSKYDRVGEKRGGPAPRGMDHFAISGGSGPLTIDTSIVFSGVPIGTDTTGQGAEGPFCVGG